MDYVVHGLVFAAFVLGYIVGRLDLIAGRLREPTGETYQSPLANKRNAREAVGPVMAAQRIDINTATVVTAIDTAGMRRAGAEELGKTTATNDDIASSVSKLAQLKGK